MKFRSTSKVLNFDNGILKISAFKRAPDRSVAELSDINVELAHNNKKLPTKLDE